MTETKLASTGIKELDAILRSLWIGDNVVWEIESGTYMDLFADHLAASAQKEKIPFVYISFNRSPATMSRRLSKFTRNSNFLLLDCFTSGKGRNDATFARFYSQPEKNRPGVELVKNPSDPAAFLKTLNKIEEAKGPKTRYVFDSLTGIQDLWGDEEKVYKLFTHSCPRLYDMDTIAYWILEKDVHSPAFKANLKHITQVALELISTDNSLYLKANKVEGRFARNLYKPRRYEVIDDAIHFMETEQPQRLDIGTKIKTLRAQRGITQRELADKVGVTASFVSQVERNQISPSITSLIEIAAVLCVEPAYFLVDTRADQLSNAIVCKTSRRPFITPATRRGGASVYAVTAEAPGRKMEAFLVELPPSSESDMPIFSHKGEEFIFVQRGKIELALQSRILRASEGETIYLDSSFPTGWKNPGKAPAQLLWVLSPSRL